MTAVRDAATPAIDGVPSISVLGMEIQKGLRGFVRELVIEPTSDGVVLHGRAYSFYGKQLAQQELMVRARVRIRANRIRVD